MPNHVITPRRDAGGADITRLSPADVARLRARLVKDLREQTEFLELRRQAIQGITRALSRIDDGTYGTCQGCNGTIPIERLELIPHARLCVTCRANPWEAGG